MPENNRFNPAPDEQIIIERLLLWSDVQEVLTEQTQHAAIDMPLGETPIDMLRPTRILLESPPSDALEYRLQLWGELGKQSLFARAEIVYSDEQNGDEYAYEITSQGASQCQPISEPLNRDEIEEIRADIIGANWCPESAHQRIAEA